ncbi:MAG: type III pantothenate kinase, partial [Firmicutes bacterium]|nr:type III pantothenate kinase [Bacillota bacterium]
MLLALDVGNTNIVIGCCGEDKILFIERIATNQTSTELEYAMIFKNILEIYDIDLNEVNAAIISSVVPNITNVLK